MESINLEESTWNRIWSNSHSKNSYSLIEWRDERADDKVGFFIQSGMQFKMGERVLDAGCGDASILFSLKKHFDIKIMGADFSESALANAKNNSLRHGMEIEKFKADTRELPFVNNSIDKIFSLGVIEHLPDPEIAVHELSRCLAPNGQLVLMTPNKYSFGRLDRCVKNIFGLWKFAHQDEFSTDELSSMAKRAGLVIQKTEVVKRRRFENDSIAFKLIFIFDSIAGAFFSQWGFYSYVFATKGDVCE